MNHKRKAKILIILWISTYLLAYCGSIVYFLINAQTSGSFEIPGVMSGYQITVFALVLCYFLPLMNLIYRNAKAAGLKHLTAISKWVQVFLAAFSLLSAIVMIVYWLSGI